MEQKNKKVYTKNTIDIATFFGGPLAGVYMMYKNYLNLGNEQIAKKFLKISLLIIILFYSAAILFIPTEMAKKFQFTIGLLAFIVIHSYMTKNQAKNLDEYLKNGGSSFSTLRGFGVFFVSIFLQFALLFVIEMILSPILE